MKSVYPGRYSGYVVKCDMLELEIRLAEGTRGFNIPVMVEAIDEKVTGVFSNDLQQEYTVVSVTKM